jgi:hypothetical protein
LSAPAGTFTYWVVQVNQVGNANEWTLQVLDMETTLQNEMGVMEGNGNKSPHFTFKWKPNL